LDIIKKLIEKNPRDWNTLLKYAMWVDRTKVKSALGNAPYHLVYGTNPILPVNLRIPVWKFANEYLEKEKQGHYHIPANREFQTWL